MEDRLEVLRRVVKCAVLHVSAVPACLVARTVPRVSPHITAAWACRHCVQQGLNLSDIRLPVTVPRSMVVCPITKEVMRDPVVAADEQAYERAAIQGEQCAGSSNLVLDGSQCVRFTFACSELCLVLSSCCRLD